MYITFKIYIPASLNTTLITLLLTVSGHRHTIHTRIVCD